MRERIERALERVGMSHRMHVRPDRLSGGEQQRVAVARALAQEPSILLADEPTGALDAANAENIMTILRNFADERKATVFLISHDPMTERFADQRLVITDGVLANV
ncbi:ABC transporter ATP-binding protein YtrE [compost metagenome]